jgi:hypothetical protein
VSGTITNVTVDRLRARAAELAAICNATYEAGFKSISQELSDASLKLIGAAEELENLLNRRASKEP